MIAQQDIIHIAPPKLGRAISADWYLRYEIKKAIEKELYPYILVHSVNTSEAGRPIVSACTEISLDPGTGQYAGNYKFNSVAIPNLPDLTYKAQIKIQQAQDEARDDVSSPQPNVLFAKGMTEGDTKFLVSGYTYAGSSKAYIVVASSPDGFAYAVTVSTSKIATITKSSVKAADVIADITAKAPVVLTEEEAAALVGQAITAVS